MFDDPFWIGLFERIADGQYSVCKVTFGAEPKDYEVYEFYLSHGRALKFSPLIPTKNAPEQRINPKRAQRRIKRQLAPQAVGTKAQQALQLQREQGKTERTARSREQREAEKQLQFDLRREKKKARHKGRG